jgi:hypothetical protein
MPSKTVLLLIQSTYTKQNFVRQNCINFIVLIKQKQQPKQQKGLRYLNAGLLATSHFASGWFWYRPNRQSFHAAFIGPSANVLLFFKFHAALHASPTHTGLQILKQKFRPNAARPILSSKFRSNTVTPLNLFLRFVANKVASQCFTFSSTCVYKKEERALPGNSESWNTYSPPSYNITNLITFLAF